MKKKQVLFLCTGNSCRSQMAEGLVNHFLEDRWTAHSAGTQSSGYVHPLAVQAMSELGIDISAGCSKSVEEFRQAAFDVVVTVCDDAAENCPIWLGQGRAARAPLAGVVHLGFPDPAEATGSEAEKMAVFRQVRDAIRQQVLAFLEKEISGADEAEVRP
jgi:arsenate reductase